MKRTTQLLALLIIGCCAGLQCPGGNPMNPNIPDFSETRVALDVVKLTVATTTERGPAVGEGVIAFNANGNAVLAWVVVGEDIAREVPAPTDMDNDASAFHFSGKKLVIRDRRSGSLYVFDAETENVQAMPGTSINMGGSIGPDIWEVDQNLVATVNSTVTTTDGAGRRIKVVDISDIDNYVITPFTVNPIGGSPDAIDIDATTRRVIVRDGDTFYLYDLNNPTNSPQTFGRSVLQGGTGSADIQIQGDYVVFFDDSENFTVLNLTSGVFMQPARNPARAGRGVSFEDGRFAFFTRQNDDDGSTISVLNRCLVGGPTDLTNLVDPDGAFVNGTDATDGRFGYGAFADVSPDGTYVFVSGETIVDVSVQERLFLSTSGGVFKACVETADFDATTLNAIRASGAGCSNNLVAWNYPIDPDATFSTIGVAYAILPP